MAGSAHSPLDRRDDWRHNVCRQVNAVGGRMRCLWLNGVQAADSGDQGGLHREFASICLGPRESPALLGGPATNVKAKPAHQPELRGSKSSYRVAGRGGDRNSGEAAVD